MGIFRRMTTEGTAGVAYPFIFNVTVNSGTEITLPLANYGSLTPTITVDWGDSSGITTITSATSLSRKHTYSTTGTYSITIRGFLPSFTVNNSSLIRSYITSIVQFGTVGFRKLDFYGCTNLTSIPSSSSMSGAGGYTGLSTVIDFSFFAASTGLTAIPTDLFQYAVDALVFTSAFQFSKITSISANIFQYNTKVTSFSSTFLACTLLTSVVSTLFDTNTAVTDFSKAFQNCRALTNVLAFTNNTSVTTFNNTYYMGSTSNALSGTAPTLWTRSPVPYGVGCFFNCTGLTNYASIPSTFR